MHSYRLRGPLLASAAIVVSLTGVAHADVVGRLQFKVLNAADEKPIAGAKITLKDSAGSRADVTLTTGADGTITSPPLENRAWKATIAADEFQKDVRDITVVADVTTEVEILLEPLTEKSLKVGILRTAKAIGTSAVVSREDLTRYPLTVGNRQNLTKVVSKVAGFAQDSVNQAHPRGEHASTSIYINGFLLPGAFQGRAGQFLHPDAIQTIDIQTGGYAPEYGGETAAVMNLTLRSGTLTPFRDYNLAAGSFGTFESQFGAGGKFTNGRGGYMIHASQRITDNALEAPQPDRQNAHNGGRSSTFFGNFDWELNKSEQLSLVLNTAPGRTEVANRTGLPGRFADLGQGFGYAGRLSAEDAAAGGIVSQQEAKQDIYQQDGNNFSTLQWRKSQGNRSLVISLGGSASTQNILNNNPNNGASIISPGNTAGTGTRVLPEDSSIEFSPNIRRKYNQLQLQANATVNQGRNTLKYGALYSDQSGRESYQLIPGSQTALNELYALDQRLAPTGGTFTPGATDEEIGTYTLGSATNVPTLSVRRSGYYAAAYVQNTTRFTDKLTVNYGARFDAYKQTQNIGQENVNESEVSPRVNVAYAVNPKTTVRTSYNRLFSQPPLAQGAILGESIKPQLSDLVELSVERQLAGGQSLKLAGYSKWNENQLDTAILVEGTQIGVFATTNIPRSRVRGTELTWEKQPTGGKGWGGYLTWANVVAQPAQPFDDPYNDHDQLNTITAGANFALSNGSTVGLSVYHGSGVFSSALDGRRQPRTELNLSLASGPTMFKNITATLGVENLLDSRQVINFQSPFTGTRFQQGRRIMLGVNGKF
jgi:outer membrane receptor protein involved in Fe transport